MMEIYLRSFVLPVSLLLFVNVTQAASWILQDVLHPVTNVNSYRLFGVDAGAVSIYDDRIVVGARSSNKTISGAVYVFDRTSSSIWGETTYLESQDNRWGYGASVAISEDHLVVGAPTIGDFYPGRLHIYRQVGDSAFLESPYNTLGVGSDTLTGSAVAIDGMRGAVGGADALIAFHQEKLNVTPDLEIEYWEADTPSFGSFYTSSLAISGNTLAVGSGPTATHGSVFISEIGSDGRWVEVLEIKSSAPSISDFFGARIDLDDDRLIVSAILDDSGGGRGAAYIYEKSELGDWLVKSQLQPSSPMMNDHRFGYSVAISGNRAIVGANDNSAYIFERDLEGNWLEVQKLILPSPAGTDFGRGVDIGGDVALVWGGGEVYVYTVPEPETLSILLVCMGFAMSISRVPAASRPTPRAWRSL